MILHIQQLNVYIQNGDNIITADGSVACVYSIISDDKLKIQTYEVVDEVYDEFESLNNNDYPQCNQMNLKELVVTSNVEEILASNIVGLPFIFHIDEIESGIHNISGIQDAFYIRYRKITDESNNHQFSIVPIDQWHSFTSVSSYPSQYYNLIRRIQNSFKDGLNPRRWNECRKTFHRSFVVGNIDMWELLKKNIAITHHVLQGVKKITTIRPRIRMESLRIRTECELIRVENEDNFMKVKQVLGDLCFVGACKMFPKAPIIQKVGKPVIRNHHNLKYNDYVNLFLFEQTPGNLQVSQSIRKITRRTSRLGFDLIFDHTNRNLSIVGRYVCLQATSDTISSIVGSTRNINDSSLEEFINNTGRNQNGNTFIVRPGNKLCYDNKLYEVTEVKSNVNEVVISSTNHNGHQIPMDLAKRLILERLTIFSSTNTTNIELS